MRTKKGTVLEEEVSTLFTGGKRKQEADARWAVDQFMSVLPGDDLIDSKHAGIRMTTVVLKLIITVARLEDSIRDVKMRLTKLEESARVRGPELATRDGSDHAAADRRGGNRRNPRRSTRS